MGSTPLHMPLELFKEIADQANKYFPKVKLGYAFTEPLIYSHLEASLFYAKQKNLFTSITTNALGLKKWSSVLISAEVSQVNVSLDGPPSIHNAIRGNEHSFSRAMEGVEALAKMAGSIEVNIYCVITEWNAPCLIDFLDCLEGLPVKSVGLMHSNFTPENIAVHHNQLFGTRYPATPSNISDTKNDSMDTRVLWKEIQAVKNSKWNFQVDFFPEIGSEKSLEEYYRKPENFFGKRCMDIFSNLMIKSNGDIIPAHGRCYNLTIGNIYKSSLKEIWNSAAIAEFRKTITRNGGLLPACSRCCSSFVK